MSEYEQLLAMSKRKRKAPERLEVSFDSDKSYGSSSATILADGRMVSSKEASSTNKEVSATEQQQHSSSPSNNNNGNGNANSHTKAAYDVESLKKSYRFEKNVLPDGDRDMNMDKVFFHEHETPFAPFIEESSEPWDIEEIIETNLNVTNNFTTTTIQVGLFGPIVRTPANTATTTAASTTDDNIANTNVNTKEYYMMPQSPSDVMEKWDLSQLVDIFLLGGKLPIKVEFSMSSGGNKRKKMFIGFVFSLERNEDGYIVCYSDRSRICIQRVFPLNMKILDITDSDRETIVLMERELRRLGVLI